MSARVPDRRRFKTPRRAFLRIAATFLAVQLLVMAKAPLTGRVKTRLCPPLTLEQAADYAEAALADTLDAVADCGADDRVLALDGSPGCWLPSGFRVVPQRGDTFNERLSNAWMDAGGAGVQIGMDTPQVDSTMLDAALALVGPGQAVLGLAADGGWWALGLPAPDPHIFDGVPMSRPDTGARQRLHLERSGYTVHDLGPLVDVDDIDDARTVAKFAPDLRSSRVLKMIDAGPPGFQSRSGLATHTDPTSTLTTHE